MSRQLYSSEFKQQVLQEVRDTHNATIVARRHPLSPSMVRRWTREVRQDAGESQGVASLVEENTPLKRLVIERDWPMVVLHDALRKKGIPLWTSSPRLKPGASTAQQESVPVSSRDRYTMSTDPIAKARGLP